MARRRHSVHLASPNLEHPALGSYNTGNMRHDPGRFSSAQSQAIGVSRASHLNPLVDSRRDITSNVALRSLTISTLADNMPCTRSSSSPQGHGLSSLASSPRGRIGGRTSTMSGNRRVSGNGSSPPMQLEETPQAPQTPQTPQAPRTPQKPGNPMRRFKHNRNLQINTLFADEDAIQMPPKSPSCGGGSGSPSACSRGSTSPATRSNSPAHQHLRIRPQQRRWSTRRSIDDDQFKGEVTSRASSTNHAPSASPMAVRQHRSRSSTQSSITAMSEDPIAPKVSSADLDRELEEAIQKITVDQAPKPSTREQWEELSQDEVDTNEEDINTPQQPQQKPGQSSVLVVRTNQHRGRNWTMVRSIGRISARLAQIRKRTMQGDLALDLAAEHHHITVPQVVSFSDFEEADYGSQSSHDTLAAAQ